MKIVTLNCLQTVNNTENNNTCSERKECKFPLKDEVITTKISESCSIKLEKTTTKQKTEHYLENISKNRVFSQKNISSSEMTQLDNFHLYFWRDKLEPFILCNKEKKLRYFVACKNILQRTIESCSEKL